MFKFKNEQIEQIEQTLKKPKNKRKIRRILFLLFLLAIVIFIYWYYCSQYLPSHEPEPEQQKTNTDAVYSEEQFAKVLKRNTTMGQYLSYGSDTTSLSEYCIVPGLKSTVSLKTIRDDAPDTCTSMTPQGLAITEDYIVISAYCRTKEHLSVLYVLDRNTHDFIKEIILPTKAHVGGLAYDTMNHNLWISGQGSTWAQANAISLQTLEAYNYEDSKEPVSFDFSYNLYRIQRASFMTYHDGALFVGFFTKDNASVIEKYLINADGTLFEKSDRSLTRTTGVSGPVAYAVSMQVISGKVQGMAFYNNQILLTRSYGFLPSEVQVFNYSRYGILSSSEAYKTMRFPERLEQIYQDGDEVFVLFESAAYSYRPSSLNHIDRVIALDGAAFVK